MEAKCRAARSGAGFLVWSVCSFKTHKGSFAWNQASAHGRLLGNGIPGKKRDRPCPPVEDDTASGLDGAPARPLARRGMRRVVGLGGRASSSAPAASAAPAADAEAPGPEGPVGRCTTAGLGIIVADDAGCYHAAIRAQLYPLLSMTGAFSEDHEGVGAAAACDVAGDPMDVEHPYESLATCVFRLYEMLDGAARAVPTTERRRNSRSGLFNTTRLRALQ